MRKFVIFNDYSGMIELPELVKMSSLEGQADYLASPNKADIRMVVDSIFNIHPVYNSSKEVVSLELDFRLIGLEKPVHVVHVQLLHIDQFGRFLVQIRYSKMTVYYDRHETSERIEDCTEIICVDNGHYRWLNSVLKTLCRKLMVNQHQQDSLTKRISEESAKKSPDWLKRLRIRKLNQKLEKAKNEYTVLISEEK